MLVLSIDTTSAVMSLALLDDKEVLAETNEVLERGQAELLIPRIDDLMVRTGKDIKEINAIAVDVGPGSFTGVRVGLATARALGMALNVPVWGVTSFEASAFDLNISCVCALDTKRDDFYVAFMDEKGGIQGTPKVMTTDELKSFMPFKAVGDGAEKVREILGCQVLNSKYSPATAIGKIALERKTGEPVPFYLREADVTV